MIIYFSHRNIEDDSTEKLIREITEINSISKIKIKYNNQEISMIRDGYNWNINHPIKWGVNYYAISKFLNVYSHIKLSKFSSLKELKERGEILEDYGIDSNSKVINVTRSENSIQFILGAPSRDGKSIYCQLGFNNIKNDEIWRISKDINEVSTSTLPEWTDMTLINTNFYKVDSISASFKPGIGEGTQTVLVKDKNEWKFTYPFIEKANSNEVRLLISNLLNEKISEIEGESSIDLKNEWKAKLVIMSSDTNKTFYLSDYIEDANRKFCYCATNFSENIFKIKSTFIDMLQDWTTKLREKRIFNFDHNNITEVKVRNIKNEFSLKKDQNLWVVSKESNKTINGDSKMIEDLIRDLNQMEVSEFISFNPSQQQIDTSEFDDASVTLDIVFDDTSSVKILSSKTSEDASLWKVFIPQQSILCLVEEKWSNIVDRMSYEFRNKIIFNEDIKINSIKISENSSNAQLNEYNNSKLLTEFESLTLDSYLNTSSKDDGTWYKGDWVPWKYKVDFRYNQKEDNKTKTIMLSERLGATLWLGCFRDSNLTFNLKNKYITSFQNLINQN